MHALLATGAIHQRLIEAGLRCDANLVVDTGTARNPHEFAVLIGFGATAIHPWLAYQCIADLFRGGQLDDTGDTVTEALHSYRRGINKGLSRSFPRWGSPP